jgi:hypothetical protein
MSMSSVPTTHGRHHAESPTEPLVVNDFLGLAEYLAGAVTEGRVTFAQARAELVAAADLPHEARGLRRAAIEASARLGSKSLVAHLLSAAA